MSVLDELGELEARVRQRMDELRPLLEEYRELEEVAVRLGIGGGTGGGTTAKRARSTPVKRRAAPQSPKRASPRRQAGRRAAASTSRPAGSRADQVVQLVRQRPGVTVRDVGGELGVDPTSLYRVVRQLEAEKKLKKVGRQLQPA